MNVIGSATNTATVTANNQAAYRRSNYFRVELTTNNSSAAVWLGLTNLAVLNNGTNADTVNSVTGNVFVAQSPEVFAYDSDGNLTGDGRAQVQNPSVPVFAIDHGHAMMFLGFQLGAQGLGLGGVVDMA